MQLAVAGGPVARRLAVPEEVAHAGLRSREPVAAVVMAVLSREDADPARRADGVLRIGLREAHATRCEPVEVRRDRLRMTGAPHLGGVVLIGEDDENVIGLGHVGSYDVDR